MEFVFYGKSSRSMFVRIENLIWEISLEADCPMATMVRNESAIFSRHGLIGLEVKKDSYFGGVEFSWDRVSKAVNHHGLFPELPQEVVEIFQEQRRIFLRDQEIEAEYRQRVRNESKLQIVKFLLKNKRMADCKVYCEVMGLEFLELCKQNEELLFC